jgi:DNA-binding SARP family transcriptional activator
MAAIPAPGPEAGTYAPGSTHDWPILICVLGGFRLLKAGQPVPMRHGGKAEALLAGLALRPDYCLPREALLQALWPENDVALAGQSLNSLVYSVHRLLGDGIGGAPPVTHEDGLYRLNVAAGVGVDVTRFDALAAAGEEHSRTGNLPAAIGCYRSAACLYAGDLCAGTEVEGLIERERLRARYLTLLARLSDHYYADEDYTACLDYALRMLASDPCREDAHRVVMRCYVRQGERAQALRQYGVCERVLQREFGATPEPATTALFDRIRLDPERV